MGKIEVSEAELWARIGMLTVERDKLLELIAKLEQRLADKPE